MTTRTTRSVAFLTAADRRRLLPFVARWAHHTKHGRRLEHQGRPTECPACAALTDSLMQEVGARSAHEGWTSVGDVVRDLRRRSDIRRSMLGDARRRYRGELRQRSRPDRDARLGFRTLLEAARARGTLAAPARIAEKLIEWAIEYAQDVDQMPEPGTPLPFGRLAQSLSKHFGTGYTADEIREIWEQVLVACAEDPRAWQRIDELVLRHGDHAEDVGLELPGPDGAEQRVDELPTARPLWAPADGAGPSGGGGGEADLVDAAAAQLRTWMASLPRKPSATVRRGAAAAGLRAELRRRHPAITDDRAARFLDEREPAFAELVDEVLAETADWPPAA